MFQLYCGVMWFADGSALPSSRGCVSA